VGHEAKRGPPEKKLHFIDILTNYCNRRCKYCFAQERIASDGVGQGDQAKRFLSLADLETIIAFFKRSYSTQVGLLDGEPTLHPDFPAIIDRFRADDFRIKLFSNGLMPAAVLEHMSRLDSDQVLTVINVNHPDDTLPDGKSRVAETPGALKHRAALVGPSGAGKTTLLNLLPRFYEVTRGAIRIDGEDIREVTLASLRSQIGLVTQQTILFHDTVRFNVAYGRLDASEQEIIEALQAAHAYDFTCALPQGLDTVIGDQGVRLSGGERQRLAIARAILKTPPILLLDEATSSLDSESEREVQQALDRLIQGRSTLVIAHRLSTVRNAHRLVIMEGGRIIQTGTHADLFEQGGLYRRLYELQFATGKDEGDTRGAAAGAACGQSGSDLKATAGDHG